MREKELKLLSSYYEHEHPLEGERNLISAVIYRALLDLLDPEHHNTARVWIQANRASTYPLSFRKCCSYLDVDYGKARSQLIKLADWARDYRKSTGMVGKLPIEKSPLYHCNMSFMKRAIYWFDEH